MKIYVAGPMSGYPEHNFPAFHAAADKLRKLGHEVVNPAELNLGLQDDWKACMKEDIRQLMECDAVYMLRGWPASKGALLEHRIAQDFGMTILQEYDYQVFADVASYGGMVENI